MLETRGYRVLTCTGGQQALERFKKGGVDLVLTDLTMPGLDGSKLIEEIKSLSPHTPAILLSGKIKMYDTKADVFCLKECTRRSSCWSVSACCWFGNAVRSARSRP